MREIITAETIARAAIKAIVRHRRGFLPGLQMQDFVRILDYPETAF